jgi:uncharacterized membrane protein YjdF
MVNSRYPLTLLLVVAIALAARELLIRRHYVNGMTMTAVLSVCVAMTVSALYELIEWLSALAAMVLLARPQNRAIAIRDSRINLL